jgi:hypothetical protein
MLTLSVLLPSYAQEQPAGVRDTLLNSLKARQLNYPGLPMLPISDNGAQTMFMSPDGRYIITGNIKDLWDGTEQSTQVESVMPALPAQYSADAFYIEFGTGDIALDVFVSFSCVGCVDTLHGMFTTENLAKYRYRILPLSNNPTDKVIVDYLYCAPDKHAYFKRVFVDRNVVGLTQKKCATIQSTMNNALAKALEVRALPLVHNRADSTTIIGNATDYL